ncbi:MAG TPA: hypothetical protein VFC16_07905 [Nakamurella sp.]|nr:hypothetical protein [Nakamurella sp.]
MNTALGALGVLADVVQDERSRMAKTRNTGLSAGVASRTVGGGA